MKPRGFWNLVQTALVLLAGVVVLTPIVWIALAAFKHNVDVFSLRLIFTPTLENFARILEPPYEVHLKLLNSAVVAVSTVLIAIPLATCAAYSFSRFRLPGEKLLLSTILATQFVPAVVIVLPFFLMFRQAGLLDSRIALVLVDVAVVMPFSVWMIKGFIDGIPLETEEAAMVDGSSRLQVIRNVVLPMAAPGIITAAIFAFIISWNEFLFALILTRRDAVTLPVGLQLFNAEEGVQWHLLSAAGLLIMAPMILLALAIQKHFVQGMTMGAVR
ncbi:carbohydrate ABC transporter permease (plasmid) [Roseomonas sp. OT10]|uniref:carbohydrate ABC transporter permease n=1 Tax=Roseomonas cutis TaxID=2897332 RepID=UPI001E3D5BFE|nr:carbohydrate ABC transporter permease [Roseomonas sp. OT10]UFN51649.1 carbohydrate ABC transporter permease [Roseomonas sp. OT10]